MSFRPYYHCFNIIYLIINLYQFSSVTQSCLTLCGPYGLQHARLPCPSPSPRVCSNSCPLSRWCHPTISSSVTLFSSCHPSFSASGSFPIPWLLASGDQSIGASAPALVLPVNIQDCFPLGLTGLISLLSKGLSRVFSGITVQKHQFIESSTCEPSSFKLSKMRMCVPSSPGMSDIAACLPSPAADDSSALSSPPSLPPPVLLACSLNASPCVPTIVLYYCTSQGTKL